MAASHNHMSLDDIDLDDASSSTHWRAKYNEVFDMLSETRAELDDFHHASKELEAELENELQRTEKAQQDLKVKVAKAETERDDWKTKFMSLQTTHNTTTTSLQRELDKLRQEYQQIKVQLRELEMGNDDLERNERAVSSSLADMEAKYSKALEEKILLEHELLEKASLEEESQRLKDELRDANVEISILKDQISASSSRSNLSHLRDASEDNLLNTAPPADLQLSELSPSSEMPPPPAPSVTTPKASNFSSLSTTGQSVLLHRAGFPLNKSTLVNSFGSPSGIARSGTFPSLHSPTNSSPRTPTIRPNSVRNASSMSASTTSSTSTTAKNKGVQMVSEMRARVRNLEQKIHTRVPRLRMGSITGRPNNGASAMASMVNAFGATSSSSSASNASTTKTSLESLTHRRSADSRNSNDINITKKDKDTSDSSGWVLIMEDSPSPVKDKEKERKDRRRLSSPTAPTAFRPAASIASNNKSSPKLGVTKPNPLAKSTMSTGVRRPQSRLSGGSLSTTTTPSSIPTPSSRPSTPTFLPVPSAGLYGSNMGMKRSTGPSSSNAQLKRSSIGMGLAGNPPASSARERPVTLPPLPRPASTTPSSTSSLRSPSDDGKALPHLPGLMDHSNITIRSTKSPPPGAGPSVLAKSRIGRPSGGGFSGRKSAGDGS